MDRLEQALRVEFQFILLKEILGIPGALWCKNAELYRLFTETFSNQTATDFKTNYFIVLGLVEQKKEEFKKYQKTIDPAKGSYDLSKSELYELKVIMSILIRTSTIASHGRLVKETEWWKDMGKKFRTLEGKKIFSNIYNYHMSVETNQRPTLKKSLPEKQAEKIRTS